MLLSTALSARFTNFLRDRGHPVRRHTSGGRRRSRPLLELLEDRTLLSIQYVESTMDSGPASLRGVIGAAVQGDIIEFAIGVTGTITLTSGPIEIPASVAIEGPGAGSITVSGNGASGVFGVEVDKIVTIAGLTITDGGNEPLGGALINRGTLTLANCAVSNSSATDSGGAIYNSGTLTVTNCTLSDNSAPAGGGGAISNAGILTVSNSTLSGNSAGIGGGISSAGETTLINTTLSDNSAQQGGGFDNAGFATLTDCTVSGNSALSDGLGGGGIYNVQSTLTVNDCTIAGNSAPNGSGGGLENTSGAGTLANTIIANDTAHSASADVDGNVGSLGYNLIGNSSGGSGFVATDILNVDPDLGPIQNNGGPTQTMALLPGSPAIDAGSNKLIPSGLATDQRSDPRDVNGVDIGAFEVQVYLVYSTADSGGGSLRTALANANQDEGSIISLTASGVISLVSPLPAISSDVQIVGPGANNLTVDGNGTNQVFDVDAGVTVTIAGLTITRGHGASGGGILNSGTLTLTNLTLSNNLAAGAGGGIDNLGTLTLTSSTLSGNSAGSGGGIDNDGTLTVTNSTFSDNSASADGGGVGNLGTLTVSDSTFSGNSAGRGGGIAIDDGALTLGNTIIATNTALTGPDLYGTVISLGNNLIGNSSGGSGFVGTDLVNVNPLLGPLQHNGGPTQTLALLPGSPAIAAGSVARIPPGITTDQRGSARIVKGKVDIGAFQSRGFTFTVESGNNQQTTVNTSFASSLNVMVTSPYGDPVQGGVVTFNAPATGASATFPGGSKSAAIDAAGQAGIQVVANAIAGSFTLNASAGSAAGPSFILTNTPGAPTQLVIHTQPSRTGKAGHAFATQPVIFAEDRYGNLETSDNHTKVKVALRTGTGPLHGVTIVKVSGGIAKYRGLAVDKAQTIVLVFKSGKLARATSKSITIRPSVPALTNATR